MRIKNYLLVALLLSGLAAFTALAADISGQWTAEMPGREGQTQSVTFTFKVDGEKLTGTIANPRGEVQITDGKIVGDEISFVEVREAGGNQMRSIYKGKVSGDEIKFTRQREGGQGQAREFVAKRKAS